MNPVLRIALLAFPVTAIAACATAPAPAPVEPVDVAPAPEPEKSAHDRLFDLFKASDEAYLKRNPMDAIQRGDRRYADRLGDMISDEY